jgi:hypothetical protein
MNGWSRQASGLGASTIGVGFPAQRREDVRHDCQRRLQTRREDDRPGVGELAADGDGLFDGG